MTKRPDRDEIMAIGSAFQASRILLTAAELDLFTKLKSGPRTAEEISAHEGWDARGLRISMDALVSMGLLTKSPQGQYSADADVIKLLASDEEESILPMIQHRASMWRTWSNITEIVRTGKNPRFESGGSPERSEAETKAFIGAMQVIGRRLADGIVRDLDLSPYSKFLDIGGGSGIYTVAFLKKAPHMTATLFDLPDVIELTRSRLESEGLLDRVRLTAGDYTTDELPPGRDLALLSAIIHSNSRAGNVELYGRAFRALKSGGTLLIRDYIMDESRTKPESGALFAVNMLAATRGGDSYTYKEVREDLAEAGFKDVKLIRDGDNMDQVVAAVKP